MPDAPSVLDKLLQSRSFEREFLSNDLQGEGQNFFTFVRDSDNITFESDNVATGKYCKTRDKPYILWLL